HKLNNGHRKQNIITFTALYVIPKIPANQTRNRTHQSKMLLNKLFIFEKLIYINIYYYLN
ncbi:MAG: hypothetical protein ACHQJ4_02170, partial [Ignavibacteria bacterium]